MEREIKRLIGAFGIAGFLLTVSAGIASGSSAEVSLIFAGLAAAGGMLIGGIIAWMVWRS